MSMFIKQKYSPFKNDYIPYTRGDPRKSARERTPIDRYHGEYGRRSASRRPQSPNQRSSINFERSRSKSRYSQNTSDHSHNVSQHSENSYYRSSTTFQQSHSDFRRSRSKSNYSENSSHYSSDAFHHSDSNFQRSRSTSNYSQNTSHHSSDVFRQSEDNNQRCRSRSKYSKDTFHHSPNTFQRSRSYFQRSHNRPSRKPQERTYFSQRDGRTTDRRTFQENLIRRGFVTGCIRAPTPFEINYLLNFVIYIKKEEVAVLKQINRAIYYPKTNALFTKIIQKLNDDNDRRNVEIEDYEALMEIKEMADISVFVISFWNSVAEIIKRINDVIHYSRHKISRKDYRTISENFKDYSENLELDFQYAVDKLDMTGDSLIYYQKYKSS